MCKPIFAWKPWLCFTWNNKKIPLTLIVRGMDLYLSIKLFKGGCLCVAAAVLLLVRFSWSCYLWSYDMTLDGYLDAVAFGIQNHAFVIPVAGGSGLPYYGDSIF